MLARKDEVAWPFDPEVISRSIAALQGGPSERYACLQYLLPLTTRSSDEAFRRLLEVIQQALLGAVLSQLGQDLSGRYHDAWQEILQGVANGKEEASG